MRCSEARRRLSEFAEAGGEFAKAGSEFAIDEELAEHLCLCPACARIAEASRVMRQDFATAAVDDLTDTIPFAALKTRVETQASLKHRTRQTENTIMAEIANQFRRRPRLSVGVVVIALIILGSVLIPIRYNKTIGYEVAVAGVDKDLAMDKQRVIEFLDQLGVSDASIEVSGCDTTCILKITELKSAEDAQIVLVAFEHVPNVKVSKNVTEISTLATGNLIEFTADRITMSGGKLKPLGEIKHLVVDRIGEQPVIVLSRDSTAGSGGVWTLSADSQDVIYEIQLNGDSSKPIVSMQTPDGMSVRVLTSDGVTSDSMILVPGDSGYNEYQPSPHDNVIDLRNETVTLDGRTANLIRSNGKLVGYWIERNDGTLDTVWFDDDDNPEDENPEAADKEAAVELPEGYELGQNYPNPFNPTTRIDYSVPTAQLVKIDVVNINGQVVRTLVDEVVSAGTHTVEWDATTDSGHKVATGVYIYRLMAGEVTQTRKMTYVK